MSTKEAYKDKTEAEVDLAQAKLTELKAKAKGSAADAQIKDSDQIDELEQKVNATSGKLKELGEAGEDSWEQLKAGVEHGWDSLSSAVRDAVAKFKK